MSETISIMVSFYTHQYAKVPHINMNYFIENATFLLEAD